MQDGAHHLEKGLDCKGGCELDRGGHHRCALGPGDRLGRPGEDEAAPSPGTRVGPLLQPSLQRARLDARPLHRLLARPGHHHRPAGGQDRTDRRERPGRRATPRAGAAPARQGQHPEAPRRPMNEQPGTPASAAPRLAELFGTRDPSLALAAAALVRIADERGGATFGELAIAYRDEFLKLRAYAKGSSLPEAGSLSVDDARTHLQTSVLPRLAVLKILAVPAGVLWSDAPVAFTPEAWQEIPGDREPAAAQLLEAAERAVIRAETAGGEHPQIAGASLLETFNLVKTYKSRRVVNDVSVRLEQGEIVGLLGPNGAGKTTTFYMMTGLVRPDGGRIALDGRDLTDDPMYRRARMGIGYLAQEPSVFRKWTVEQNLLAILETLPLTEAQRAARLEQLL